MPDMDSEDEFDPFTFLAGMGEDDVAADGVGFTTNLDVHGHDPLSIHEVHRPEEMENQDIAASSDFTNDVVPVSCLSCFEFWQSEGLTPALVDSLSRHLSRLRLRGFQLPWTCSVCGSISSSWLGACQECKAPNETYSTAAVATSSDEERLPAEVLSKDHVLLTIARAAGKDAIEACFLMCEAMARKPDIGMPLFRRAFKLWPALDSDLHSDGVPAALRSTADALLRAGRPGSEAASASWGIFPPHWETPASAALAGQLSLETEQSRLRLRREPDVVVVYSYHQAEGTEAGCWWEQARRSASALRRMHEDHIEVAIHLVSNIDTKLCDKDGVFDEHVLTDLAADAQLPRNGRALCGTKIQAILNRFHCGYRKVVYMDSDTHILRAFLSPVLAALDFYDVTGVFEGYPLGLRQARLDPAFEDPRNFEMSFEVNTGVLGLSASAVELCHAWLNEFRSHARTYAGISSADQPALMQVLKHRRERVFPLPPAFNFRCFSVFSPAGPPVPAVVHDHGAHSHMAHKEVVEAVCTHLRAGLIQA